VKEIIFIFKQGRKDRLENEPNGPKEFFYTFHKFEANFKNVGMIENKLNEKKLSGLLFKLVRKVTNLPIYTENFLKTIHLKTIFKANGLIATNQNLSFSILPILIIKRLFKNNLLYTFAMGLVENQSKKQLGRYCFSLFLKISEKIFFISRNEYEEVKKLLPQFNDKFVYIPFSIDTNFWTPTNTSDKKNLLFIGNDVNRDYDFIKELAKEMKDFDFIFITQRIKNLNLPNVQLIQGNWNDNLISDLEIKKFYESSYLTLIPLRQTYQPSGQSVALQSISMNTPVLITKTKGFWDSTSFIDSENILFLENNSVIDWKDKIIKVSTDKNFYNILQNNGKELINQEFNIEKMYSYVLKELDQLNLE